MINKIKEIINGLNEQEKLRLKAEGYTNECFFNKDGNLTENYEWKFLEKKKYIYINCGTSGVFMVNKEDGEIFNIKGYGTPDKNKKIKADLGNIKDYFNIFNGVLTDDLDINKIKVLHKRRYNYLR